MSREAPMARVNLTGNSRSKVRTKKMLVTLTLEVEVACITGIERVFDSFVEYVENNHWDEGRYDFNTEQLGVVLRERFKNAVSAGIYQFFENQFGCQMVPMVGCDGEVRRSCMELKEWMDRDFQWLFVNVEQMKCSLQKPAPDKENSDGAL